MDRPSKVIIIGLIAALILVSATFAFYVNKLNYLTSISSTKDLSIGENTSNKNNLIKVFDSPHVRVDILISSKRNDGTTIEEENFEKIRTELATRFGGVTVLPHFNGTSIHNDTRFDGANNSGFYVVVPNTVENLEWFSNYKQTLKDNLQQDRIFMTFSPTMIVP